MKKGVNQLILNDPVAENSGYYQCVASNNVDYATGFGRLKIVVAGLFSV